MLFPKTLGVSDEPCDFSVLTNVSSISRTVAGRREFIDSVTIHPSSRTDNKTPGDIHIHCGATKPSPTFLISVCRGGQTAVMCSRGKLTKRPRNEPTPFLLRRQHRHPFPVDAPTRAPFLLASLMDILSPSRSFSPPRHGEEVLHSRRQ